MSSDFQSIDANARSTNVLNKGSGSLQQFQTRIAQRIAQAQADPNEFNSLLSIGIQQYHLLMPLTDISELIAMPSLVPVPLSKQWVLGFTVVRAEILTVFNLAHFVDLAVQRGFIPKTNHSFDLTHSKTQAKPSVGKLVVLNKATDQQLAFKVDSVAGTISPEKNGLVIFNNDLPKQASVPNHYIKNLWRDAQDDIHIELSLIDLFKSRDFTDIVQL
jgi:chemotaxis signal transduction protein